MKTRAHGVRAANLCNVVKTKLDIYSVQLNLTKLTVQLGRTDSDDQRKHCSWLAIRHFI